MSVGSGSDNREVVRGYHALSKHRPDRYAPGPGRMDWANQPDPFRRFAGCARTELPLLSHARPREWAAVRAGTVSPPAAVDLDGLAALLELSLGLAAWKRFGGSRWALRCNPSSGNLHPTECYLVTGGQPGLAPGVHHYEPYEHVLEQRAALQSPAADALRASLGGAVLVGLSAVHWREAWKYGVRAFRYCQHDAGHAIAAVAYAASLLGWQAVILDAVADSDAAAALGVARVPDYAGAQEETFQALLAIGPPGRLPDTAGALAALAGADWRGRANRLSRSEVDWPDIGRVAAATAKAATAPERRTLPHRPALAADLPGQDAASLIRQRRSAQAFDGQTPLDGAAFFHVLDALLPREGVPPWSALPWEPAIHPLFFVHRVTGLAPGLYVLPRSEAAARRLRTALAGPWLWETVDGCPEHVPLRLLLRQDLRSAARTLSCHQEIAADSAFGVAMLADLGSRLDAGPHWYRWLHWEAGALGQVLYLEAEADGIRGTGIGCYFDDATHEALRLADARWQDLYQFTVGTAVDDSRLQSEPAYGHLGQRRRGGAV
jgi:SagB-type dehydrogenase family enzyme